MSEGAWEALGNDAQNSVIEALSQWLEVAALFGRSGTINAEEVKHAIDELTNE